MQIIDNLLNIIAPHYCLECDHEGALLCNSCIISLFDDNVSYCVFCQDVSSFNKVCQACQKHSPIKQIWIAGEYEDVQEQLIRKLKFERTYSAAITLATILDYILPPLPSATLITYIPTAPSRVRLRGYDQSRLVAQNLARIRRLKSVSLFKRNHSLRQLKKGRKERLVQAESAFRLRRVNQNNKDSPILLLDDVITTGATLNSAAKLLKNNDFENIVACAVAKRSLKR